jgi:hypothetical protein
MIQLLPEEERHEEFIAIYTDFALSLGSDHGSTYTGPDRIPGRASGRFRSSARRFRMPPP